MMTADEKKDLKIRNDVIDEITWDQSVTMDELSVTSHEGVVTLRGTVPHYSEKIRAEAAALRVTGVRAVASEIEVKMLAESEREDDAIAKTALNAFDWNYQVPKNIKITVDKGWIELRGEVEWDYQKTAAQDSVTQLRGVVGVTNNITLKPTSFDIKSEIDNALERSSEDEAWKNYTKN